MIVIKRFIHSFIQQMLFESLLCGRYYTSCWREYNIKKKKTALTVRRQGLGPRGTYDSVEETHSNKIYCSDKCETDWSVSKKR